MCGRIIDVISKQTEPEHIGPGAVFPAGDHGEDLSGRFFGVRGVLFSYDPLV